ncbi:MAG: helix-turn-helix domain-containing protein [Blastocatellia bacterium]|nr:helix-turn-helix domain-containing protein [Blastocatellia bacterium]
MKKKNIVVIRPSSLLQRAYNLKDAAKYLGMSPSTLIKLSNAGEIPCYDTGAHRRSYLVDDLDAFLTKKGWKVYHKAIPRGDRDDEGPKGA